MGHSPIDTWAILITRKKALQIEGSLSFQKLPVAEPNDDFHQKFMSHLIPYSEMVMKKAITYMFSIRRLVESFHYTSKLNKSTSNLEDNFYRVDDF